MSKYRCPVCGASHKSEAERCRLCGQSLLPGAMAADVPRSVAGPARKQRGMKGVVLIGIAIVLALGAAALFFGVVHEDSQIRKARGFVTGEVDGWSPQIDDEGRFRVELPGTPTRSTGAFAGTDSGSITAWQSSLGDDTQVRAGWGTVTPPLTDGVISTPIALQYLRETVVPRWAAANGLEMGDLQVTEVGLGGLPAVRVRTLQSDLKVTGKDAFGQLVVALDGTRLFVIDEVSIYKDATQLDRMASSFSLTALS
jgi:hypothetical protein